MDKIFVRGLRLFGRHGVLQAERKLGQPFTVDMELRTCVRTAGDSDDMSDAVDYARAYAIAREIVEGDQVYNLVEKVASRIATETLREFPGVHEVKVRVTKPHVAFAATLEGVGVEITRGRETETETESGKEG